MTPTNLKAFGRDEDDLVEKLQEISHALLKLAVMCHYSVSVVTSRIWAQANKKDLEGNITLLRSEKIAL